MVHFDGSVVLERTTAGQQAVLAYPVLLGDTAQRLLSMATGYTDLATLAALLGDLNTVASIAQDLIHQGLMRVVEGHPMSSSVLVPEAMPFLAVS